MPAPEGNKYTEKYDLETAKQFFQESLDLVIQNTDIVYIGQVAVRMNTYRQIYDYLIDKFGEQDEVFNTTKKIIDTILETRCVERGLNNKGNASFIIFHMKNNHGWDDKYQHEVSKDIPIFPDVQEDDSNK